MTPSPMRAEYQRVASEMPASTTASPAMNSAIRTMPPAVPSRLGDPVDDVAGQQRGDHADQRGPDDQQQEERSARGGRGGRCRGSGGPCPSAARAPSTDGIAPERPHRGHGGHRMAHVHTASFPSTGQHRGRPGCSAQRQCLTGSAASDKLVQPLAPGRPARRRPAPRGRCGRRSAPAPPSPGWPPPAARCSAATRSATVASSSAAGTTALASPIARASAASDGAAGQADLQRPRVADQLDERAGAGQVGHQPERRLGQPQLRVVGEDPQVAGERELRAGADRVPLHGRDRDDPRRAQPAEAGLVAADPLLRLLGGQPAQVAEAAAVTPGSALNRLRSRPAEKDRPSPRTHDHADVVVERRARRAASAAQVAGVCALSWSAGRG